MKRRFQGNAALIELLIVILFFLISSVTILKLFSVAYVKSQSVKVYNAAYLLAEDWAQRLYTIEDPYGELPLQGWSDEDGILVYGDDITLRLSISETRQDGGRFNAMTLSAHEGEKEIVNMPVNRYWQKEVSYR